RKSCNVAIVAIERWRGRRIAPCHAMRPREKLGHTGLVGLSDQGLVALVLGHGVRGRAATALAGDILASAGGIHGLARSTADQLAAETGLGPATAARLV